jgi:uncharacterized protein YprB with RNaseH-like and TPR domain
MPDFGKALSQLRPKESPQRLLFQSDSPVASLGQQLAYLKSRTSRQCVTEAVAPDGIEEITPFGRHLAVRKIYGADEYHGNVRLGRFSCSDLQRLSTLMKGKASVPHRDSIVFLDTETTGLHGGTGMVPFLVGLGYFSGEDFIVIQYFIRDFDEEPSMLLALGDILQRFKLVVTYNGATFDLPLLEARFTLARLNSPFGEMGHLDLLPAARRLWRNGHGSCRLAALENKIAGFLRGPDIPGAMIPRSYFDFLQGRGASTMNGVLKHNVHDIVSLAALTVCAADRVVSEPARLDNPLDLFSLGRIVENTAEWKRALTFYEWALAGGLPDPIQAKARENLAVLCRRAGDHARALGLCRELMAGDAFSMIAYEGAAIYYERVAGDALRALEVVDRALSRLEDTAGNKRYRVSLQARRERLKQKAIVF